MIAADELEVMDQGHVINDNLKRPRAGDLCPVCQLERLDYDGLLNLSCPECGAISGGCFT